MRCLPLLALFLVQSAAWPRLRDPAGFWKPRLRSSPKYSEEWLDEVPLDHFSFATTDSFSLRFFINEDSFEAGGPILFYTGNEGSLEGFAENTVCLFSIIVFSRVSCSTSRPS